MYFIFSRKRCSRPKFSSKFARPKFSSKFASFLWKEAPFWLPEYASPAAFCFGRNRRSLFQRTHHLSSAAPHSPHPSLAVAFPPHPTEPRIDLARFDQWRTSAEAKTRYPAGFLALLSANGGILDNPSVPPIFSHFFFLGLFIKFDDHVLRGTESFVSRCGREGFGRTSDCRLFHTASINIACGVRWASLLS